MTNTELPIPSWVISGQKYWDPPSRATRARLLLTLYDKFTELGVKMTVCRGKSASIHSYYKRDSRIFDREQLQATLEDYTAARGPWKIESLYLGSDSTKWTEYDRKTRRDPGFYLPNLGILAVESGLVLIDLDVSTEKNGIETWNELASAVTDELRAQEQDSDEEIDLPCSSDTLIVRTGSGGQHEYFTNGGGITINGAVTDKAKALGIDIFSGSKYVLSPFSIHPNGNGYIPLDLPIIDLAHWNPKIMPLPKPYLELIKRIENDQLPKSSAAELKSPQLIPSTPGPSKYPPIEPKWLQKALQVFIEQLPKEALDFDLEAAKLDCQERSVYLPRRTPSAQVDCVVCGRLHSSQNAKLRVRGRTKSVYYFCFQNPGKERFISSLEPAEGMDREDPTTYDDIIVAITNYDFGTDEYNKLYQRLRRVIAITVDGGRTKVFTKGEHGICEFSEDTFKKHATNVHFTYPVTEYRGDSSTTTKRATNLRDYIMSNKKYLLYQRSEYKPYPPGGYVYNPKIFNTFEGWGVTPVTAEEYNSEIAKFISDHAYNIMCGGDRECYDYLENYLAHALQFPMCRPGVIIVFDSRQGAMKNKYTDMVVNYLFGKRHASNEHVFQAIGNFNTMIKNKMCIVFNEMSFSKAADVSAWKAFITEVEQTLNEKHEKQVKIDIYARLFANVNDILMSGITLPSDDRRTFVVRCSDKFCPVNITTPEREAEKEEYYRKVEKYFTAEGMRHYMHYLLQKDLSKFRVDKFPNTELRQQLIDSSKELPLQFIEGWDWTIEVRGVKTTVQEPCRLGIIREAFVEWERKTRSKRGKSYSDGVFARLIQSWEGMDLPIEDRTNKVHLYQRKQIYKPRGWVVPGPHLEEDEKIADHEYNVLLAKLCDARDRLQAIRDKLSKKDTPDVGM